MERFVTDFIDISIVDKLIEKGCENANKLTYFEVFKWLLNEKSMYICPDFNKYRWYYKIYDTTNGELIVESWNEDFVDYDEALIEGVHEIVDYYL